MLYHILDRFHYDFSITHCMKIIEVNEIPIEGRKINGVTKVLLKKILNQVVRHIFIYQPSIVRSIAPYQT